MLIFQVGFSQNDCSNALVICGNSNFSGLSATGIGIQELSGLNTCFSEENNSIWLKISIVKTGTLSFTLVPESSDINVDFDFFVFGPNVNCGTIGSAIRCSTTNPNLAFQINNLTGMNSDETDTSEGPGPDGNSFVSAINANQGETYFIVIDRPIGESNFSIIWTGDALFNTPPNINISDLSSANLSNCDSDTILDNRTLFNLTPNASRAIGSQSNVVATFHTLINDALTNTNAISTNYRNTSNPQQIFMRLTDLNSSCFVTTQFDITVIPFITNNPVNIEECDNDNNGIATFNLRRNDSVLKGTNTGLTITYHPANNSNILLADNYVNSTPYTKETVWAKITDISGCYTYKPFDLIIKNLPPATQAQLTQCDIQFNPDGLTTFNLNEANTQLTGGNTNYITQFYTKLTDATYTISELNPIYQNIQNPQLIYVRVTDTATSCYSFTSLILNVNINSSITIPLRLCDNDGTQDGFVKFDLTNTQLANSGNTVTYYANSMDTLLKQNALSTDFINSQANQQRIYARIENANNCVQINSVDLYVDPMPEILISSNDTYCLNRPNKPVILDPGIGDQNPNLFDYLWMPNSETTPSISVLASGTYSVRVTNSLGCSKMRTIIVKDSDSAIVENIHVSDLTDNNTVNIYVKGDVTEFNFSLDHPKGPFQLSNFFDNVSPGIHTIYIADIDGCDTIEKEISVLGIPAFFTPNGDGYNDTWRIKGMEKEYYRNSIIYIYDRYGKLLKQLPPNEEGWNGTFNNQVLPATDYWYLLQLEDGRETKGHFSLKR